MPDVLLTVSTQKGVFLFTSANDRDRWDLQGPYVRGLEVNDALLDARTGTLFATANDPWFGPTVRYSADRGDSWTDARANPRFAGDPVVEGEQPAEPWFMLEPRIMDRLWVIEPGRPAEEGVLYCGVAPAALFRSDDSGRTWRENAALSNHETRERWQPGAGDLAAHSIVLDPANDRRMWVAISAAGVFRTEDGGDSWQTASAGIRSEGAQIDPSLEMYPEWGLCVHHVVHAPGGNDRLYAQSHWGTYRSDDGGTSWNDITAGLPAEFGFVIEAHPRDPDTAYVIPLVGGEFRCPPDGALRVWRTRDAGEHWEPLGNGLPQSNAFMGVYRQSLASDNLDPAGVYFGTNTGQVYVSRDEGDSWRLVTADLPPVTSVRATPLT